MADLSITAASVVAGSDAKTESGIAGASVTAGQPVYLEASSSKYKLADSDSATAEARVVRGISLHAAAANQPLAIQTDGTLTLGATLTVGAAYYLSATAGGICPVADLATGMYPTFLGWAISTTVIDLTFVPAGVARP